MVFLQRLPIRLVRLARRAVVARRYGFGFYGRSRFAVPRKVRWCDATRQLDAPFEEHLPSDVVNILLDGEYGLRSLSGVNRVIDVGASIGLFTMMACDVFPQAIVHAYEPTLGSPSI